MKLAQKWENFESDCANGKLVPTKAFQMSTNIIEYARTNEYQY
jgi:hypothetical protein